MEQNIVETINLCKTFKHQQAVSNLNMKVKRGAIYGFIGKNGAGKSTTLKMICGLTKATSGEINLFGDQKPLSYRSIGALIENIGAYPEMTAKENMQLKATGLGLNDKTEINRLLKLVKLSGTGKKTVKQFSLGMKQRLGIALALLGNPDLLILDEPTNGLDPQGIREIRNVIIKLNKERNMTIIISSHILGELSKMATHYGIIKNGLLIEQVSQKQLLEQCKSYLSIIVTDIKKTAFILEDKLNITNYEVYNENEIWIYDESDSAKINYELVKNGINISQIYYQKQDLESYFLERIGGN